MITPEHILPTIDTSGNLVPVQTIFENHRLAEDELDNLTYLAHRMQGLIESFGGAIGMSREHLHIDMPWLDEWAKQMDSWVDAFGLLLPVPITPGNGEFEEDDEQGFGSLEMIVQVGVPTPDHMDTYAHMPIGLSIGLQGERELVGVAFDEIGEVFEAQRKLQQDGKRLADLEEFEGRDVQRILQKKGDVTQIAGFATLHSGRPLETFQPNGEQLHNAVAIIGYLGAVAAGAEDVLEDHMARYYRPAADTLKNAISGNTTFTSVY